MIAFHTFECVGLESFDEIWCVDAEYSCHPGCQPEPICVVARELRSGRELRLWQDELATQRAAPFRTDERMPHRLSSACSTPSAGRHRRGCSTCSSSSAPSPMV